MVSWRLPELVRTVMNCAECEYRFFSKGSSAIYSYSASAFWQCCSIIDFWVLLPQSSVSTVTATSAQFWLPYCLCEKRPITSIQSICTGKRWTPIHKNTQPKWCITASSNYNKHGSIIVFIIIPPHHNGGFSSRINIILVGTDAVLLQCRCDIERIDTPRYTEAWEFGTPTIGKTRTDPPTAVGRCYRYESSSSSWQWQW